MNARTPFPYQLDGATHLASAPFAALLDEPGLGKSWQALMAAQIEGCAKILVVGPAISRVSWAKESTLAGVPVRFHSFDEIGRKENRKGLLAELLSVRWDVLIVDEAHYAKSRSANRSKALYGKTFDRQGGLAGAADRVWLLSGTLAPNHPGELWTHVVALFPAVWERAGFKRRPTLTEWEDRFCQVRDTAFGRSIAGANKTRLAELGHAIAPVVLRRKKADVLQDLPPIRFTDEPLDMKAPERGPFADAVENDRLSDDEVVSELRAQETHLATARRELGLSKVKPATAWIEDLLAGQGATGKVVVFAHHTQVIDQLAAELVEYGPVKLTGATGPRERVAVVDRFQGDPACRVFIGQIQAAGTAITLTAAKDVVVVEPSWVPSDNYQAVCRCHRIGQKDGVHARFLYAPKSLDERVMKVFRRKAEEIAKLFD